MTDVPSEIVAKMERFCAFQERCESDVRRKLTSFRLSEEQENAVLKSLIDNRFLDDERYTESFVRSKVKSAWGRQKIVAALHAKGIPSEIVDRHCARISASDYAETLRKTVEKWRRAHPGEPPSSPKLLRHLLSKGYSAAEALQSISP